MIEITRMKKLTVYDFTHSGFRLRDKELFTHENSHVHIRVSCKRFCFPPLIELLPNVKYLEISFYDNNERYDVSSFKDMPSLQEILFIAGGYGEKVKPRLLKTRLLIGKIPSVTVYGKKLTLEDPSYPWPKIRDARFVHINKIHNHPGMIVWDVKCTETVRKAIKLSEENQDTSNIIVQKVGNKYYVVYKYFEGNHAEDLEFKEITEEKFCRIMFNFKRYSRYGRLNEIPCDTDGLWINDGEDVYAVRRWTSRGGCNIDEIEKTDSILGVKKIIVNAITSYPYVNFWYGQQYEIFKNDELLIRFGTKDLLSPIKFTLEARDKTYHHMIDIEGVEDEEEQSLYDLVTDEVFGFRTDKDNTDIRDALDLIRMKFPCDKEFFSLIVEIDYGFLDLK
jgi:hypothetical protein